MSENQLPWWNVRRPAGFRFSAMDAVVIAATVPATWALWAAIGEMGFLLPVVLGHFFLFCNIFRVPRQAELAWGGLFTVNVCLLFYFDLFLWWRAILFQSPATLLVITIAMLRRDYHGLGWSKIRPRRLAEGPTGPKGASYDDRV